MPVTVGVLGAGTIAKSFMEAAPDVPDLEVAVICDVVKAAARAMAEPHSIAWVTDYREVLENGAIQAVYVALPHHLHAEAAVAAAGAGKHILLEKPMANTLEEADRILAAQAQAGVKLMLGFTHRFHSELESAKGLILAGELGRLTLGVDVMTTGGSIPGWFWQSRRPAAACCMSTALTALTGLRWLMGSEIVEVFAYAETYDLRKTVEDSAVVAIRFENGAMGTTVHTGWLIFRWPSSATWIFTGRAARYGSTPGIRLRFPMPAMPGNSSANGTRCSKRKSGSSSAPFWKTGTRALTAKMAGAVWPVCRRLMNRRVPANPSQ